MERERVIAGTGSGNGEDPDLNALSASVPFAR